MKYIIDVGWKPLKSKKRSVAALLRFVEEHHTVHEESESFLTFISEKIDEMFRLINTALFIGWFAGCYYLYENYQSVCKWLS